jgi:hypothetical protein
VSTVAERFGRRRSAPTQEDAALARDIVEIAIPVTQIEVAQISGQEIRTVLRRDYFDRHGMLLGVTRMTFFRFGKDDEGFTLEKIPRGGGIRAAPVVSRRR